MHAHMKAHMLSLTERTNQRTDRKTDLGGKTELANFDTRVQHLVHSDLSAFCYKKT